jgi:hypothetical protein
MGQVSINACQIRHGRRTFAMKHAGAVGLGRWVLEGLEVGREAVVLEPEGHHRREAVGVVPHALQAPHHNPTSLRLWEAFRR